MSGCSGDLLGEVISESGGADLLADVERLRHAVIDARQVPDRASASAAAAGDAIAGAGRVLVAGPGRAGGARLHRLLPPGQPGRRAAAGAHAAAARLRRRGAARVARRRGRADHRRAGPRPARRRCCAGLVVHPVFTAHPTEARRRAVVASLRRIGALLTSVDDYRAASRRRPRAGPSCSDGCARRSTCSGGRRRCGWPGCRRLTRSAR